MYRYNIIPVYSGFTNLIDFTTSKQVLSSVVNGVLLDVALAAQLVGVAAVVAPLDVGLFVLPVPRLDEDNVTLLNPDPVLHPAGDAPHPHLAVLTAHTYVVLVVLK